MKSALGAGAHAARQERERLRAQAKAVEAPAFGIEAKSGATPAFSRVLAVLSQPMPAGLDPRQLAELFVERLASALPGFVVGAEFEAEDGTRVAATHAAGAQPFELSSIDGELSTDRLYVRNVLEDGSRLFVASPEHGRALRALHRQVLDVAANLFAATLGERRAVEQARRARDELARAEKFASLGKVVTSILHELNNPLTSILSYADRLATRLGARTDADDYLEPVRRIKGSAERLQIFARDLVFHSRPSSEAAVEVSLGNVLDKATFLCEHEFAADKVRVVLADGIGSRLLYGVPDQLVRVFVNLFTNAAHAMSERGGALAVAASADPAGEFALITVSDEGDGVTEADLSKIFEPFFTTKAAGKGMGLGLAIVRDIVTAHHGAISVASVVGSGTTFELRLPLARDDQRTTRITNTKIPCL